MIPKVVSSIPELLDVLRERRAEIDVSLENLDHVSGVQPGYSAKVLSPDPVRGLGPISLPALLGALALGIVRIEIAEDAEQRALISHRWRPRRRPQRKAAE
jgi:hypothetical protein